ncbi:MAG TPA: right-handed parallel beta-helix repeat-containing protein [Actinomycetota bacterium]|nr:right-handed parallel beta-helix repeat-containing protein [Actinomycetota bacterium]
MRRAALLGLPLLAVGVVGIAWGTGPVTLEVSPDASRAAVSLAPDGAVVRLLPGTHPPLRIERAITLEGTAGAVVEGPVTILADGAAARNLSIRGGEDGLLVREADDVVLDGIAVTGPTMHGIEIVDGSARVSACSVTGPAGPQVQGLEVRNANGRPRTIVEGCTIRGGMEGIVSHVSRVEFRDNLVEGTTLRGLAVTEMSEGLVEGNTVRDASGIAYYCGDMSHCEIRRNTARGIVDDGSRIKSRAGYGAVAWYYATMRVTDNDFRGVASPEPVGTYMGSILTESFPLSIWAPGWVGAVPGIAWAAGALLLVALTRLAVGRWAQRPRRPARPRDRGLALNVLLVGFAVQSFHMLEHTVQVWQVYVADAESRSGIAGSVADAEWVHFTYNLAVLFFMVWAWRAVRPGGVLHGIVGRTAAWFLAATVVQTYHFAEHTAKIIQHVRLGIDPAPGIIGGTAGLVWFHFAINLAVYAGMTVAMVAVLRRTVIPAIAARVRRLAPAGAQPEPPISS